MKLNDFEKHINETILGRDTQLKPCWGLSWK